MKSEIIQEMQDELFRRNGQGWFRILSSSMYPLIEINDRILVHVATPAEIRLKDVILFKSDGVLVAHRVIGIDRKNNKTNVLQKGDASADAGLIAPESIVGKVTAVEKKGRLLDITAGRGKMLNRFLAIKSRMQYRYSAGDKQTKDRAGKIQGDLFERVLKKIFRKPMSVFQRILVKLLMRLCLSPGKQNQYL